MFLSCRSAGGGHPRLLPRCSGPEFTLKVPPEPPPFRVPEAGLNRRERNVLIFLLGEVVLARNGLFSGGEHGVRLALFMNRLDRK